MNPVDTLVRDGRQDKEPAQLPKIPGTDFAGVVAAVGSDLSGFAVGDRVFGDYLDRWTPYQGTFAEYVAAPEATIVSIDASGGEPVTFTAAPLARRKDVALYQIGPSRRTTTNDALSNLARLLAAGDLTVEIARTYDLEDAAQTHRDVIEESFVGKLVVTP